MAAAMPAGMFHFTVISFPMGVAFYVNTFVAQYEGAGRPQRIGPIVWQGIWIGVLATPLLLATIPVAPAGVRLGEARAAGGRLETTFYQVLTFGSGAMIIAAAQTSFFTGRGQTRVVMFVDTAATLLNAGLDYVVDLRPPGLPGRRHRRRRLGHGDRRVVPRARLCLHHAPAGLPRDLSAGGRLAARWEH